MSKRNGIQPEELVQVLPSLLIDATAPSEEPPPSLPVRTSIRAGMSSMDWQNLFGSFEGGADSV